MFRKIVLNCAGSTSHLTIEPGDLTGEGESTDESTAGVKVRVTCPSSPCLFKGDVLLPDEHQVLVDLIRKCLDDCGGTPRVTFLGN